MSLLLNMLSRLVITFLPRSKRLLISWLPSPSAVILEPPKIKSATVSTVSPSISHEVMGPDAMIRSLGQDDPLEKGMATHSSILAWRIPRMEEPGRLQSMGSHSPWGCKESDMTERLHFHFSLSCIEEVNGNPLQYSCLENPTDGGAWWAAVNGVAQSWTRLK